MVGNCPTITSKKPAGKAGFWRYGCELTIRLTCRRAPDLAGHVSRCRIRRHPPRQLSGVCIGIILTACAPNAHHGGDDLGVGGHGGILSDCEPRRARSIKSKTPEASTSGVLLCFFILLLCLQRPSFPFANLYVGGYLTLDKRETILSGLKFSKGTEHSYSQPTVFQDQAN